MLDTNRPNIIDEQDIFKHVASLLKVYKGYDSSGSPIECVRIGQNYDGGYVVPELALQQADVILGYGISYDISFEDEASLRYEKETYGFDHLMAPEKITAPLCTFLPLGIKGKKIISSYPNTCSFEKLLQLFKLETKKIFVKMDIEGDEYDVIPDVLERSEQLTGISFEMHFNRETDSFEKVLQLLRFFEKDYLLMHLHGHNQAPTFTAPNVRGEIPRLLELSYLNKNLVSRFEVFPNQQHPTQLDMPSVAGLPDATFEILYTEMNSKVSR